MSIVIVIFLQKLSVVWIFNSARATTFRLFPGADQKTLNEFAAMVKRLNFRSFKLTARNYTQTPPNTRAARPARLRCC